MLRALHIADRSFEDPYRMRHLYFVSIVTNRERTVLYTGVTNNLEQRSTEHYLNRDKPETFAGKYNCYWLVYYEERRYIRNAIAKEKEIKSWSRERKLELIYGFNPACKFLNEEIMEWPPKDTYARNAG